MPAFQLSNPECVYRAASSYSHAALLSPGARRVLVSGQVGARPDGSVPEDPAAQVEQLFHNLESVLGAHGLGLKDVVKQVVFLTDRSIIAPYRQVRARLMGDHAPVSTLVIVAGLVDPRFVIEIEAEAVGDPA